MSVKRYDKKCNKTLKNYFSCPLVTVLENIRRPSLNTYRKFNLDKYKLI